MRTADAMAFRSSVIHGNRLHRSRRSKAMMASRIPAIIEAASEYAKSTNRPSVPESPSGAMRMAIHPAVAAINGNARERAPQIGRGRFNMPAELITF